MAFPIAERDRTGVPVFTAAARRLLGGLGWEARALVAHLLVDFFDPWEHLFDSFRTLDDRHLLPVEYRVSELGRALEAPEDLVDTWICQRLLRFRPAAFVLTATLRGARVDDDDQLDLPDVPDTLTAVEARPGEPGLFWSPPFVALLGGLDRPRLARVVGRCVVNRDWPTLDGWLRTEPRTGRVEPTAAVVEELRRQLLGSQQAPFDSPHGPFQEEPWLRALIDARLRSACWPTRAWRMP